MEDTAWKDLMMATEKIRRLENSAPLAEGEFWRITGIGEATEQRLHAAGIDTFERLGSLSPEDIASILTGQVGVKERAARQDWTSQARRFAYDLKAMAKRAETADSTESQHYESFLFELLIEDDRSIKRTKITRVRDGEKTSWAGWDSERFLDWIAAQAELSRELFAAPQPAHVPAAVETSPAPVSGAIVPADIVLAAVDSPRNKRFYDAGQPLELRLTLDLSSTAIPANTPLTCRAIAEARNVLTGRCLRIGEVQAECAAAEQITLHIPIPGVEPGTYFLETAVQLHPAGALAAPEQGSLSAVCDAGVFHIFAPLTQPAA
jgi:hypothetical protein